AAGRQQPSFLPVICVRKYLLSGRRAKRLRALSPGLKPEMAAQFASRLARDPDPSAESTTTGLTPARQGALQFYEMKANLRGRARPARHLTLTRLPPCRESPRQLLSLIFMIAT